MATNSRFVNMLRQTRSSFGDLRLYTVVLMQYAPKKCTDGNPSVLINLSTWIILPDEP